MKIIYYLKRSLNLGFAGIARSLKVRYKKNVFSIYYKNQSKKALNKNWLFYSKKYSINCSFVDFFNSYKKHSKLSDAYSHKEFQKHLPKYLKEKTDITFQANKIVNGKYSVLGSKQCSFDKKSWPWHHDIKLQTDTHFLQKKNMFYQNIKIENHHSLDFKDYYPDVKVPWEISRMHQIPIVGLAYSINPNENYSCFFKQHISSWLNENPFLRGINWLCPMDVSIRSINLIWGMHFFKKEPRISIDFWEKITISLLQHEEYIRYNWEESDRPNNHYLADLLGYFYICIHFRFVPFFNEKLSWVIKKLKEQFNWQIQKDGTSYEGSTAYHKLDTEMFLHFYTILETYDLKKFESKETLKEMLHFTNDCYDYNNNFIQIGDNDSGKIVFGIEFTMVDKENNDKTSVNTYKNFGLTVIKNKNIHISFRHIAYNKKQPTGHFHEDQLSITLGINGIPLFVDPGTYLYTSNPTCRNYFRSRQQHNTISILNYKKENIKTNPIFQLDMQQADFKAVIKNNEDLITISDADSFYENIGIKLTRNITYNKKNEEIKIIDNIQKTSDQKYTNKIHFCSFFNINPKIHLKKINSYTFSIILQKHKIALLKTNNACNCITSFHSPEYGIKQKTTKLVTSISMQNKTTEQLILIINPI